MCHIIKMCTRRKSPLDLELNWGKTALLTKTLVVDGIFRL